MKIKFLGAARAVTGSCFVIETDNARFAVDCGMHQGNAQIEKRNWDTDIYEPERMDFFLITHAHIDHSGLLPRVVKKGFRGPVYLTEPTGDLVKILLLDSAHIQETEAGWKRKRLQRRGNASDVSPLYTKKDAEAVAQLIKQKTYNQSFSPADGITVNFQDAGHILGAAIVEIFIEENGTTSKLVFTGDIGRRHQLMVEDPKTIDQADFLFIESTYGDRNHKGEEESLEELFDAIDYSYSRGEKIIIPAFAVERTQEMLYSLYLLNEQGRLPKDLPVYLDSPLAIKATEIFRLYHSYMDKDTRRIIKSGDDPLNLPQLQFSLSTEQSMQINEMKGSAIVISASGMCNAGRIKHHLRHNLWRPGASIVFVGYQAQGTPGRRIVEGVKKIRIFNDDIAVKAKIWTIGGFSAHAGQTQLLDWLRNFTNKKMPVFLVHGEYSAQETLAALVREKLGFDVTIPDYQEEILLKPKAEVKEIKKPAVEYLSVDWNNVIGALESKISDIKKLKNEIESLPLGRQMEIRDALEEMNMNMDEIKTDI
ncbi:MAG TPA: MBL fold metallo-hydrolase [Deltaproteobacteria bacterium]|mgnify:CR=1 FL=1|nr:MBL fold metallo-hydrolase [Deltaproteobacteria bacterium]